MHDMFDANAERYDQWFDDHVGVYESEVAAVRRLLPGTGSGLEIGSGTGRFSVPFGITEGVEPSAPMRRIAERRGARSVDGVGEVLPHDAALFDFVLMVTTICFADDPAQCCREAFRVLKFGGAFVIGLIDKTSFLGRRYELRRERNVFYRRARLFSVDEVVALMTQAGFGDFEFRQTLFGDPADVGEPEPDEPGQGRGAFAVVRGFKKRH